MEQTIKPCVFKRISMEATVKPMLFVYRIAMLTKNINPMFIFRIAMGTHVKHMLFEVLLWKTM